MEGVFVLSKRRLKFSKTGMAKYISHLDLLRCFTRAVMRSGLPVEYSQGFNPHQKMAFALPLPVGVTSECEYVDISFTNDALDDERIIKKLNQNLPPDIRIISAGDIICRAADIVCAEYFVTLKSDRCIDSKWIKEFFGQSEVTVLKKTKKKIDKPVNIMDYIRAWEIIDSGENSMTLRLVLDAGGERNIKPDVVIGEFCKRYQALDVDEADIHRKEVFCKSDDEGLIQAFV